MKLSMMAGYSPASMQIDMDKIREAESLGYECVWTAEAYGSDAVSPAAWILAQTTKIKAGTAIMQMPARAPAMTAMTAMTLNGLSGGRFVLGLGPSGPQVVEGWYGVPYGKPLTRTREYIKIIRDILKREGPLTHEGEHYMIPNTGPGTTGQGKALKSILHGDPTMPIYTAAISPNGVRCAGEVADGVFPLWMNPERFDLFEEPLNEGFAKAGGGKSLADFDVAPAITVIIGDVIAQCMMPVKSMVALYVGGMGSRKKNFYNDYTVRMGFEAEANQIQDLFLDGKKAEAIAAVPDELIDQIALVGPADRIRDRLGRWKDAGAKGHVGTLLVGGGSDGMRLLAEELL